MAMRGALSAAAAALLFVAVSMLACSSGGGSNDGGGGAGGGGGATGGGGGATTNTSCQDIRLCIGDCADDACIAMCKARGTAAAQTAFQALDDCLRAAPPTGGGCTVPYDLPNCLCPAECLQDPPCGPQVDACVAPAPMDLFCDMRCH
jgi:hypothetical protein